MSCAPQPACSTHIAIHPVRSGGPGMAPAPGPPCAFPNARKTPFSQETANRQREVHERRKQ